MLGWGRKKCSVPERDQRASRDWRAGRSSSIIYSVEARITGSQRKVLLRTSIYEYRALRRMCWYDFGFVAIHLSSHSLWVSTKHALLALSTALCCFPVVYSYYTCFKHRTADTRRMRSESSLAHRISRYEVVSVSKPLSSSIRFCRPATSRMYRKSDRTCASLKASGTQLSFSSAKHCSIVPLVPPARIGPAGRNMTATCWLGCHMLCSSEPQCRPNRSSRYPVSLSLRRYLSAAVGVPKTKCDNSAAAVVCVMIYLCCLAR